MQTALRTFLFIVVILSATGCSKVNDIEVRGVKDVRLKGLKQNVVHLSMNLEVDNPNTRRITITHVNFKSWLNQRELGTLEISQNIVLLPCSRGSYPVDVEIKLRTVADALRLMSGSIEELLNKIEVEGYIKGKTFPFRKTVRIERQPFSNLSKSLKDSNIQ
jgi:LEA14-like dessication related protein